MVHFFKIRYEYILAVSLCDLISLKELIVLFSLPLLGHLFSLQTDFIKVFLVFLEASYSVFVVFLETIKLVCRSELFKEKGVSEETKLYLLH